MIVTIVERRCFRGEEVGWLGGGSGPAVSHGRRRPCPVGRVEYFKKADGVYKRVTADFSSDGQESFRENEEWDEVGRHELVPSTEERRAARRLLITKAAEESTPQVTIIDLSAGRSPGRSDTRRTSEQEEWSRPASPACDPNLDCPENYYG